MKFKNQFNLTVILDACKKSNYKGQIKSDGKEYMIVLIMNILFLCKNIVYLLNFLFKI